MTEEDIKRNKEREASYTVYKEFENSIKEYCELKFKEYSVSNHQCAAFLSKFTLGLLKEIAVNIPEAAQYMKSRLLHLEMEKLQANRQS